MDFVNEVARDNSVKAFKTAKKEMNDVKLLKVLQPVGLVGMTTEEIIMTGKVHYNSVRPTLIKLRNSGNIIETKKTRNTNAGKPSQIYVYCHSRKIKEDKLDYESSHFIELREKKKHLTGGICEVSGLKCQEPNLHHIHYKTVGKESLEDVLLVENIVHEILEHKYKQRDGSCEKNLRKLCELVRKDERKQV